MIGLKGMGIDMKKYRTFDGDKNPPNVSDIEAFFNNTEWLDSIRSKFQSFLTRE